VILTNCLIFFISRERRSPAWRIGLDFQRAELGLGVPRGQSSTDIPVCVFSFSWERQSPAWRVGLDFQRAELGLGVPRGQSSTDIPVCVFSFSWERQSPAWRIGLDFQRADPGIGVPREIHRQDACATFLIPPGKSVFRLDKSLSPVRICRVKQFKVIPKDDRLSAYAGKLRRDKMDFGVKK
jgi:hypothetical protein